jgi:hypothetical protein
MTLGTVMAIIFGTIFAGIGLALLTLIFYSVRVAIKYLKDEMKD